MGLDQALKFLLVAVSLSVAFGATALADGDLTKGEKIFNRCKTCHILEGEAKRLGPSLECVFGRTAGSVEGFKYSEAMAQAGVVWGHETITEYLTNPKEFIPGNKMPFPGLKNEEQLADLLAYLESATASENCPQ